MTEYVRPMDLHAHNGGCELYGCIAVVKADEHAAALSRLDDALQRLADVRHAMEHSEEIGRMDHYAANTIKQAVAVERGATLNEKCPQCGMWHVGLPCPRSFGTPLSE